MMWKDAGLVSDVVRGPVRGMKGTVCFERIESEEIGLELKG